MSFLPLKQIHCRIPRSGFLSLLLLGSLGLYLSLGHRQNPYAYPFQDVMPTSQRLAPINNELAFYEQRLQNQSDGLTRAALASSYFKMAQATGESHWYLKADQMAQQSLAILPHNNQDARLIRARVAEAKHDFPEAIALAKGVLQDSPDHNNALSVLVTSYLGQGNLTEADRISSQLVEQIPTAATYTLRSQVAIAMGNDEATIQNFQLALDAEEADELSSSEKLRYQWGKFAASRGQLNRARQLLESALNISPQSPPVLVELATLDLREGNYQDASNRYQQVFQSQEAAHTHDHDAAAGRAELLQLQGKADEARQFWAEAVHALRDHGELETFGHQREFAQILLKRGNEADIAEALSLMESEALRRQDHETLDTLAWALSRNNRLEEALQTLQTAIQQGSKAPLIYYRAAAIARQLNQSELADQYQKTAKDIDPTLTQSFLSLWGVPSTFNAAG